MHTTDLVFEQMSSEPVRQFDTGLEMAAQEGSQEAFAELHKLWTPRLYRTIFSITGNHADTEDALQDTWLRAYTRLESFVGRSKLSSWLTRIAINTSLMTLRKRRVRREAITEPLSCAEDELPPIEVKDPGPNPEEACLEFESRRRLVNAMTELEPAARAMIELQVSEQCSIKEIAQSLDVSVGTVKARLHRARRRLAGRIHKQTPINRPRASAAERAA
jgi:RNA polymerase sigma-70 factor, ECF subfamily